MAVVILKCPHCLAQAQFKVIGQYLWPSATPSHGGSVSLGAICPGCQKPVGILSEIAGPFGNMQNFHSHITTMMQGSAPIETYRFTIVDSWPKPVQPDVPEHVPESVAKAFLQAERNFSIDGHEEAAAMMYRRSLELALAQKYPETKGTLAQIIKSLVEQNILTSDLGAWANDVRLLGNEAAHDEGVTREELLMMRGFADAVLRYVWTLPTQVSQRRASKN